MARRPKPKPPAVQYCDNGIVIQSVGSHDTDPFALQASAVPISQESAERIRDEFKAAYRRPRYSNPIILDGGTSSIGNPRKAHHAFICEYCGRASQSVEPCQGCGALRTREQIMDWEMVER